MLDQDQLKKVAETAAKAAEAANPRPPQGNQARADHHGVAVAGNNNQVNVNNDTLGNFVAAARPWMQRFARVFGLLGVVLLAARLWQVDMLSGGVLRMNAWITAHDPLLPFRVIAAAALLAFMWIGLHYIFASLFKRRP